jgi:F-type H+-transporting ATPase subunit k
LAIATLGTLFVGSYIGLSGGKKPEDKAKGPPINAGSKDEENFIKYAHNLGYDLKIKELT